MSVSPGLLQYPSQTLGLTSQRQTALLRNMGSSPLSITSITVGGDFAETNNCGNSVPAAASCAFSVTFTPTAVGTRLGSILVQDDAAGSPHLINLSGSGSGAVAVLSPASLTFSAQPLGAPSTPQTLTLTNTGNATLNIGSIQATGDFSQTNNCPPTLAPNSSCTLNVTFTPTVTGSRSGTITVSDNAQGSPQTATLSGTSLQAPAPIATVTPTALVFPGQQVATSSAAQTVTLTNSVTAPLQLGTFQITGDYAQSNTCPPALAASSRCTINVTFTPKASGTRGGTLTMSDNASGIPQVVNLTVAGADFSLSSSRSSGHLKAGATATYQVAVSPVGGAFTQVVKVTCSGAPALTTCKMSPKSVTPNGSAAASTLTITTTGSGAQAASLRSSHDRTMYAIWIPGIGLFGMILVGSRARSRRLQGILLLSLIAGGLMFMIGCAGGTGITTPPQTGTAPGTYTIMVSGTSGALQHSIPVTLIVQ